MKSGVALLVSVVALVVLSTASGSRTSIPRAALYPNTVAFADRMHGALGTGEPGSHGGTIELTSNGGQSWHLVRRTRRPVSAIAAVGRYWYAQLEGGQTLKSTDSGSRWGRTSDHVWSAYWTCGTGCGAGIRATPADPTFDPLLDGGAAVCGPPVALQLQRRWLLAAAAKTETAPFQQEASDSV